MPSRRDGRVEPGQPLRTAFSASAWNRAQDAADVVLGQRPGFGAEAGPGLPGTLVVPCSVTSTVNNVKPGHVVRIVESGAKTVPNPNNAQDTRSPRIESLQGIIVIPVTLANYEDAKTGLGVVVGGVEMPSPGQPRIVQICIAGMCIARVRPRFTFGTSGNVGPYRFMSAPIKRTQADTDAILTGVGEASSCGSHRIVQYLGAATSNNDDNIQFALVLM